MIRKRWKRLSGSVMALILALSTMSGAIVATDGSGSKQEMPTAASLEITSSILATADASSEEPTTNEATKNTVEQEIAVATATEASAGETSATQSDEEETSTALVDEKGSQEEPTEQSKTETTTVEEEQGSEGVQPDESLMETEISSEESAHTTNPTADLNESEPLPSYKDRSSDPETIAIDAEHFPDEHFREYVRRYDQNKDGQLSRAERDAVTSMNINDDIDFPIQGINYFNWLTDLSLTNSSDDPLSGSTVDLRNMSTIKTLDLNGFTGPKIFLDGCTNLQSVRLLALPSQNDTTIDVGSCPALEKIDTESNYVIIKDAPRLVSLKAYDVKEMDLSGAPNLETLKCDSFTGLGLDITKNLKLKTIDLGYGYCVFIKSDPNHTYPAVKIFPYYPDSSDGLYYRAKLNEDGKTVDLASLPAGFDPELTSNWYPGNREGNILTLSNGSSLVAYEYLVGQSSKARLTFLVRPEKVASLTAEALGTNRVSLSWQAARYADGYLVYRQIGSGELEEIADVTETSYMDQSATEGEENKYCVCSYYNVPGQGRSKSEMSDVQTVRPTLEPLAIRDFTPSKNTTVKESTPVTIHALGKGGTGTLSYLFYVKDPAGTRTDLNKNDPSKNTVEYTFATPGIWKYGVEIEDADGNKKNEERMIQVLPKFKITGYTASPEKFGIVGELVHFEFYTEPPSSETSWTTQANWIGPDGTSKSEALYFTNFVEWTPQKNGLYKIEANVTAYDPNDPSQNEKDTKTVEYQVYAPLSITSSVASAEPYYLGSSIDLNAEATGGAGEYTYTFKAKLQGQESTIIAENLSTGNHTWTPEKSGSYTVTAEVLDKKTGLTSSKDLKIDVYDLPTISTFAADPETKAKAGTEIQLTAEAAGGFGTLTYEFTTIDPENVVSVLSNNDNAKTCRWIPEKPGNYVVKVTVKDGKGRTANKSLQYQILEPLVINGLTTYPTERALTGTNVQVRAEATGGQGDLNYSFKVRDESDQTMTSLGETGTMPSVEWIPSKAGRYTLIVEVTDSQGEEKRQELPFTVVDPLLVSSFTTSPVEKADLGTPITITAAAVGGQDALRYKFMVKDTTSAVTTLSDWSTADQCTWTPAKTGSYAIMVEVKDEYGQQDYQTLAYTVKAPFVISDVLVFPAKKTFVGESVHLYASTNESDGVKYKFSIKNDRSNIMEIGSTGTDRHRVWTPEKAGVYTIIVEATNRDEVQNTMELTYTVYDKLAVSYLTTHPRQTAVAGTTVNVTANAYGGEGALSYRFMVKDRDSAVTTLANWSRTNHCTWKPDKAGHYTLMVEVADEMGAWVSHTSAYDVKSAEKPNDLKIVTALKAKVENDVNVKLTWNGVENAQGYGLYRKVGKTGKLQYIGVTSKNYYTDKKATLGEFNFYFVFAYKKSKEGKTISGPVAPYVYARPYQAGLAVPDVKNLKARRRGYTVDVTWTRSQGAAGYAIFSRGRNEKTLTYRGSVSAKSGKWIDKSPKRGEINFYFVVPYTKVNGKAVVKKVKPYTYAVLPR